MSRTIALRVFSAILVCGCSIVQAAQDTTYQYQYDANGNRTRITGPLNHVTRNQYDALNRLVGVTDPSGGQTQYSYDGLDQLTQVTDPRNLVTSYTLDGLGNQTALSSPDTSNTVNTFDAAGNLLTRTDAKGQTTRYQYDALNRIIQISYADGNAISYLYDQGPNGIGRLSRITDASGSTQFSYDLHGRVVSEVRVIGGQPNTTLYRYNSAGRLVGVTYPGGRSVDYTRDSIGRIVRIDTTKEGVTLPIITQVKYQPFGPANAVTYGNGQSDTRNYDLDGRTISYTLNDKAQAISYDAASRITAINDLQTAANSTSYGYDPLDRLTSAIRPNSSVSYGYDAVGNRTSYSNGAAVSSYSYGSTSNRLTQITGSQAAVISTDPNGSITGNGANQFTYDARGRMISADTASGPVQYQINGMGQRVQKITPTQSTVFHYDTGGKLIAETIAGSGGPSIIDYVYLDDMPVAVLK